MVPSPETLTAYERLGIVGVLLGVLLVVFGAASVIVVWTGNTVSKFVRDFIDKHLEQLKLQTESLQRIEIKQTESLQRIEIKQEQLANVQNSWHRRLDNVFRCWVPECPLRAHVQDRPPHPPPDHTPK